MNALATKPLNLVSHTVNDSPQPIAGSISHRLYPPRSSGRYYILKLLADEMRRVASELSSDGFDGLVIDLGCGDMPYRPLFETYVQRYVGVDLSDNPAADRQFNDDLTAPFADAEADVVLSTQVLEHVEDPTEYLSECRRLLKPGGRLVLSTHGYWKYHPHPRDLWRWTGEGLQTFIASHGFTIHQQAGIVGLGACGLLLLQDAIVMRLPRRLRRPFVTVTQSLMPLADRLNTDADRRNDASVFVVVAHKSTETIS